MNSPNELRNTIQNAAEDMEELLDDALAARKRLHQRLAQVLFEESQLYPEDNPTPFAQQELLKYIKNGENVAPYALDSGENLLTWAHREIQVLNSGWSAERRMRFNAVDALYAAIQNAPFTLIDFDNGDDVIQWAVKEIQACHAKLTEHGLAPEIF